MRDPNRSKRAMPGHAGRFDGAWTVARSAAVLVGVALASACAPGPVDGPSTDAGADAFVDAAVTYVDAGACEAAGYTFRDVTDPNAPFTRNLGAGAVLYCDRLLVTFPSGARPFIEPLFGSAACGPSSCTTYAPPPVTSPLGQPWSAATVHDLCQVEAQFGVLDWECFVEL